MRDRPYVLLSVSMSLDGYLDSASDERLLLSNDADFDRVDELRAGSDAILVGAATVRNDDPRLRVRARQRFRGGETAEHHEVLSVVREHRREGAAPVRR